MLLVGVAVLTFASLVYFAEKVIRREGKYFSELGFFLFRTILLGPGPSLTPSGGV